MSPLDAYREKIERCRDMLDSDNLKEVILIIKDEDDMVTCIAATTETCAVTGATLLAMAAKQHDKLGIKQ